MGRAGAAQTAVAAEAREPWAGRQNGARVGSLARLNGEWHGKDAPGVRRTMLVQHCVARTGQAPASPASVGRCARVTRPPTPGAEVARKMVQARPLSTLPLLPSASRPQVPTLCSLSPLSSFLSTLPTLGSFPFSLLSQWGAQGLPPPHTGAPPGRVMAAVVSALPLRVRWCLELNSPPSLGPGGAAGSGPLGRQRGVSLCL